MKKDLILQSLQDQQESHTILHSLKLWFLKFFQKSDRFIAGCLIWLLIQIRPLFGPQNICPFSSGCTQFAILQLEQNLVPIAIWHITIRLLKCNPIWFMIRN